MRGRSTSALILSALISAALLPVGEFGFAQPSPIGVATATPRAAPFDVLAVRRKYYGDLEQAKNEAIKQIAATGKELHYNPDGTVVKDAAYREVTARYDARRQELLQTIRSDKSRDAAVVDLFRKAEVPLATDTGTGEGSSQFSGALSDRDVTLDGVAGLQHLQRLTTLAETQGYHVVPGKGYIKIPELDMIVWEPSDENKYARTFNKEDKPVRLNDPEVVIDYQAPGVTSQIHKVEQYYREGDDRIGSTQDDFEMVAALAKAAYKSVKAVDGTGSGKVVSQEEYDRLEQLKSRQLTKDDLVDPLDRPEVGKRKLIDIKEKYLGILKDCLPLDERRRDEEIRTAEEKAQALRDKAWELEQRRKQIPEGTDPAEEKRLFDELQSVLGEKEDLRVQLNSLNRMRTKELAQRKIIIAKNSTMAPIFGESSSTDLSVSNIQPGEATDVARTLDNDPSRSERRTSDFDRARDDFSLFGAIVDVTEAVTKSKALELLGKKILTPLNELNRIDRGITGFNEATGEGMRDYIRREIERYRAEGFDVANDSGLQDAIRRRAILRATGLGTWEGSKTLPILGNIVQGSEDFYHLSKASIGLGYDRWKSRQIEDANQIIQQGNLERAAAHAVASRDKLRDQMAAAKGFADYARQLAAGKPQYDAELQMLEQRIVERFRFFESLAADAEQNKATQTAGLVSENELQATGTAIAAETKLTQVFVRDCEAAIERVKAGGTPHEQLAEEQGALGRRLMDIDTEYVRLTKVLEEATRSVRAINQSQNLPQLYDEFLKDIEQAKTLAKIGEDYGQRLRDDLKSHADTVRAFGEEQIRLKDFCDRFAVRASEDENLRGRFNSIRDEVAGFHINTHEVDELVTIPADFKLSAARVVLLTSRKLPPAPQVAAIPPAILEKAIKAQARLKELDQPAAEMTRVVELARERLKLLRELSPMDAPIFNLTAKEAAPLTYDFIASATRLPAGLKIRYAWDFSDTQYETTSPNAVRHTFAAPGRYTVRVTVYAERTRVSEEIGTAAVTVGRDEGTPIVSTNTTPIVPTATELYVALGSPLSLDYDRLGNGALKDRIGTPPYLEFAVYPISNAVKVRLSPMRRGLYFEKSGIYEPFYNVDIQAIEAEGRLDPTGNRIDVSIPQVNWKQEVGVWSLGGGVTQDKYTVSDGHRLAGLDPSALSWSGAVSGELDWRSGRTGSTTGRLDVNALVSGDWKVTGGDWISVGGGREQLALQGNLPSQIMWVRLHPDIESAKRSLGGVVDNPRLAFAHDPEHDVVCADVRTLVRIDRWTIIWMRYDRRPEMNRLQYELFVKFVNGPGRAFEQLLSAAIKP